MPDFNEPIEVDPRIVRRARHRLLAIGAAGLVLTALVIAAELWLVAGIIGPVAIVLFLAGSLNLRRSDR